MFGLGLARQGPQATRVGHAQHRKAATIARPVESGYTLIACEPPHASLWLQGNAGSVVNASGNLPPHEIPVVPKSLVGSRRAALRPVHYSNGVNPVIGYLKGEYSRL